MTFSMVAFPVVSADLGGKVPGIAGEQVAEPAADDGRVVGDAIEGLADHQATERGGDRVGTLERSSSWHQLLVGQVEHRAGPGQVVGQLAGPGSTRPAAASR